MLLTNFFLKVFGIDWMLPYDDWILPGWMLPDWMLPKSDWMLPGWMLVADTIECCPMLPCEIECWGYVGDMLPIYIAPICVADMHRQSMLWWPQLEWWVSGGMRRMWRKR